MGSDATPSPLSTAVNSSNECNIEDSRVSSESYSGVLSNISNSLASSLRWCPTSYEELEKAESDLLSTLTQPFKTYFVDIGPGWGLEQNRIRTLEMKVESKDKQNTTLAESSKENNGIIQKDTQQQSEKIPLVLVHGFAAGIGTWILNLDALSTSVDRKIYAIDLIGFARSSRAPFDLSGDVEGQFVESIERWREKVGIDKFILLGHSFGGYLCGGYALRHPERVPHVIFADPWGIQDRQAAQKRTYRFPIWVRAVHSVFQAFNPLAVLRVTGPYGPSLVQKFRGDLREKFRPKLQEDCHKFLSYIYHCNAQTATGESAFKSLALPFGWPKYPLVNRLVDLDESVSMTFIYGFKSWIDKTPGEFLRDTLQPDRVDVHIIEGSGHHVYADNYSKFNELVEEACAKVV